MDAQFGWPSEAGTWIFAAGVYLVYQVDVQGAVRQLLDRHEQDFRAALRNARVPYQDVQVDYPPIACGFYSATPIASPRARRRFSPTAAIST